MNKGILYAIAAAALFGASTPFAKLLVGDMPPVMLAGLLYAGSGLGLSLWMIFRRLAPAQAPKAEAMLTRKDWPWLSGAILSGGIIAPILLMFGLTYTPASSASLLLNLEGVATSMLAWFVFKENFDRRIFIGMLLIIAGGVALSWQEANGLRLPIGSLLVAGACFCWGIDNNLTRKVSASDPVQIAGIKGLVAGIVNLSIGLALGNRFPAVSLLAQAGLLGFLGYGLSLVMFVLALRHLGTARTGAYFSLAPFVGAAISLLLMQESPAITFWLAGTLMAGGIWLHLTERHEHLHRHEAMEHDHKHFHDAHHQHKHDFEWDGTEPHSHPHAHEPMTHSHTHYPDIHHRHGHIPISSSGKH